MRNNILSGLPVRGAIVSLGLYLTIFYEVWDKGEFSGQLFCLPTIGMPWVMIGGDPSHFNSLKIRLGITMYFALVIVLLFILR
jgi:hypothetical protein